MYLTFSLILSPSLSLPPSLPLSPSPPSLSHPLSLSLSLSLSQLSSHLFSASLDLLSSIISVILPYIITSLSPLISSLTSSPSFILLCLNLLLDPPSMPLMTPSVILHLLSFCSLPFFASNFIPQICETCLSSTHVTISFQLFHWAA